MGTGSNASYAFAVRDGDVLVPASSPPTTESLSLLNGWNLVGNGDSAAIDVASKLNDATKITTVWKWNGAASKWAFYAPSLAPAALTAYAAGKGYEVLTSIAPKEGYWVNAAADVTVNLPTTQGATLSQGDLQLGWNLRGSSDQLTPSQMTAAMNPTLSCVGKTVATLWAWDAMAAKWKFHSPALESQGGTALSNYLNAKGYLPFTTSLSSSEGYWLNVGAVVPTAHLPVASLQGLWGPGNLGSDPASAVAFSDGSFWMVSTQGGKLQLYTASFQGNSGDYTASGKLYDSGSGAAPVGVAFTALATAKTSLHGTVTPDGGVATLFSFATYNTSRYETPAALADLTGSWKGTRSGGITTVTWTVTSAGALTGASSNGCSYTGTAAVHSVPVPVGVFDLTLHESCMVFGVTTAKDFSGIVTLSADKLSANFAFTNSSGSEGDVQPTTRL